MQISDERFILGIMIKIIDAHCHIQSTQDIAHMLSRADDMGVVGAICNATSPADWGRIIELAQKYAGLYGCIGVHPWHIAGLAPGWGDKMREMLRQFPTLMVGEVGLDKNHPNITTQESVFISQMKMAGDLVRPMFVHCVGAWDRVLHILKNYRGARPRALIAHAFAGSRDIMERLGAEYGFYFSYSPDILNNNRTRLVDTVRETPIERILIESDAATPDIVPDVLRRVAEIKSIAVADVADIVYKNTIRIIRNGQIA